MKNQNRDGLILGLALFAMFFGAGNLIFPTFIGLSAGDKWFPAMIGFLVTGVGLPLLGVLAVIKIGGSLKNFSSKLGKFFGTIYGMTIITSLALVAVSRTAATTFEMSIQPMFPSFSPLLSSVIFFSITLLFAINPSGIIDRIGKVLTPILLFMLGIIIFKGIISPIGNPIINNQKDMFITGFFGGYQTMDALGSVMLGGIITASLLEKGYNTKKSQSKIALKAVLIAGLGLGLVYGGLVFLGSSSSNILTGELSRTGLTISVVQLILGNLGKVILGICVAFACLTTSIGLTATVGDYYSGLTNNKVKYKGIVTITSVVCAVISNVGVDAIVKFATPLLVTLYPITIVLIALNLLSNIIKSEYAYKGAVIGAFIISGFDGLAVAGIKISSVSMLISQLPFSEYGFAWILPSLVGLLIGLIISLVNNIFKNTIKNTVEVI